MKEHETLVKFTGVVSSRIYGAPTNTLAEIESFVRTDIIRSITTRLQIYYDALLANDDGGNDDETEQDQNITNDTIPPRRVFFPFGNGKISFCDYLFQNETEDTTVKQSMDILGVSISPKDVETNVEAAIVLRTVEKELDSSDKEFNNFCTNETGKLLLMLGIIGIVIALTASLIFHFFLQ